jgi:hypothetical protein
MMDSRIPSTGPVLYCGRWWMPDTWDGSQARDFMTTVLNEVKGSIEAYFDLKIQKTRLARALLHELFTS